MPRLLMRIKERLGFLLKKLLRTWIKMNRRIWYDCNHYTSYLRIAVLNVIMNYLPIDWRKKTER